MSTTKVRPTQSLQKYVSYVLKKNGKEREGIVVDSIFSNKDSFTSDLIQNHKWHDTRGNSAFNIIHSWSPEESKKFSPEKFNQTSRKLVEKIAPGHNALIVTHTDEAHTHTHIILDPVHPKTGNRIHNKLNFQDFVRDKNDALMKERGMDIVIEGANRRLSREAVQVLKKGGLSWTNDLKVKAEFAQKYAGSFEEHQKIVGEFQIKIKSISDNNITYIHPSSKKFKRGRKLSPSLEIAQMKEQFINNREKYKDQDRIELAKKDLEFKKLKNMSTQQLGHRQDTPRTDHFAYTFKDFQLKGKAFAVNLNTRPSQVLIIKDSGEKFLAPKEKVLEYMLENSNRFFQSKSDQNKITLMTKQGHRYQIDKAIYESYAEKQWIPFKEGSNKQTFFAKDVNNMKHVLIKGEGGANFLVPKKDFREEFFKQELAVFNSTKFNKSTILKSEKGSTYFLHSRVFADHLADQVSKRYKINPSGVDVILKDGSTYHITKKSDHFKATFLKASIRPQNLTAYYLELVKHNPSQSKADFTKGIKKLDSLGYQSLVADNDDINTLINKEDLENLNIKIKKMKIIRKSISNTMKLNI